MTKAAILEDLGDNLVLRRSTVDDAEALGKFNGLMHVDPGQDFVEDIYHWVKNLVSGKHPTVKPDDFTIVENTTSGEIVSSLCLISQTWAYDGIQFLVGRPELVATHPDYRRRGLIRKQFDVVHQWSKDHGHKLQFITGIPWYYRQFGYEMAVNLNGGKLGSIDAVPQLKMDQEEKYTFRPAVETDIPFLTALYAHSTKRSLLSCIRDENIWLYELTGRPLTNTLSTDYLIIENLIGQPVGYLGVGRVLFGETFRISAYELSQGVSWMEVTPSVQRKSKEIGEEIAHRDTTEDKKFVLKSISYRFGEDHPSYLISSADSMPTTNKPYAYYMRVPDLPAFISTIAPVLEARLAESYAPGYSGELKLNFFTDGLILTFKNGRLKTSEAWEKPDREEASAHFPELTFLQLLFGYRSYDELRTAFPDVYSNSSEAPVLLHILFPKQPSLVYDLG